MSRLESYLFQQKHYNKSDKWVELSILKEYLYEEERKLFKEINKIDDLKIETHYKNILSFKIETRRKQIKNFLERVQLLIKENE